MTEAVNRYGRRKGRGIRPWLLVAKFVGLAGFLGGMAALAALYLLGPHAASVEQWRLLRAAARSIFYPTLFAGLILTVVAGVLLWFQMPRAFWRMRWFRVKVILGVIGLPACHFWARSRTMRIDAALEAGEEAAIPGLWTQTGLALLVALVIALVIAAMARNKPRLGERIGARGMSPKRD